MASQGSSAAIENRPAITISRSHHNREWELGDDLSATAANGNASARAAVELHFRSADELFDRIQRRGGKPSDQARNTAAVDGDRNQRVSSELKGMAASLSARIPWAVAASVMLCLLSPSGQVPAAPWEAGWTWFHDEKGTAVPYPAGIFTVRAAEGTPPGQVFTSGDGRARLHIFSFANERHETPAQFIKRVIVDDRRRLAYERVTGNFFVFSAAENDLILYRRCNFARDGYVHCIDLRYPRSEKLAWDNIVDRISASLRPQ
jgi:hypothetical protein